MEGFRILSESLGLPVLLHCFLHAYMNVRCGFQHYLFKGAEIYTNSVVTLNALDDASFSVHL